MIVKIKYFGRIVEITEMDGEKIEITDALALKDFRILLCSRYPDLKDESFQIAVNQELKTDDYSITQDCELAILPPFAGG